MKKTLVFALISAMTLMVAGCGSSSSSNTSSVSGGSESGDTTTVTTTTDAASSTVGEYPATTVSGDAMSYADYVAAATDDAVIIDTYVQAKQEWWEDDSNGNLGTASLYTQNQDGGFFIYNINMPKEDYDKLVDGQEIKISGYKSEWSGEVEVTDVDAYEILDGNYIAEATDVTDKLGTDDLINYQNQKVAFTDLTVAAASDDQPDAAYLYNYDGSGSEGDDLYFNVTKDGQTYSFTVESYLDGPDSDVYKAVKDLKVGDTIDCEGFLYWYEGANPHITSVTVK